MSDFTQLRVAVIATDGFEELELTEPVRALKQAGATVEILAPRPTNGRERFGGRIQGYRHLDKTISVPVDHYLEDPTVMAANYNGLVLPGGAVNADMLRVNPKVQEFVREINAADKPLAVICHAPWILISTGLVRDRRVAGYFTIKDDIVNAGGHWIDEPVVIDGNWITSRNPDDLPAFNRELIAALARPLPLISDEVKRTIARARIA